MIEQQILLFAEIKYTLVEESAAPAVLFPIALMESLVGSLCWPESAQILGHSSSIYRHISAEELHQKQLNLIGAFFFSTGCFATIVVFFLTQTEVRTLPVPSTTSVVSDNKWACMV